MPGINPATGQFDPAYVDPNAGIINGAATPPAAAPATGVGTTPINAGSVSDQLDTILGATTPSTSTTPATPSYNWNVTPDQTVQGQVAGIIDNKALSPIMERAQAGANEAANARGLINSSMGVQAGQAAVLDAALPIATADAATNATAAQFNAGMGFDFAKMDKAAAITLKQMDVQQQNDLVKLATAQGYNIESMNAQQINDLAKMDVDNKNKIALEKMDNDTQIELAGIQSKYQTTLGTNKIASDLYTTTLNNITAIQNDPKIDGTVRDANGKTAKDRAVDVQTNMLQSAYAVIEGISGIEGIQELLGFNTPNPDGTPAGNSTDKVLADAAKADSAAKVKAKADAIAAANAIPNTFSNVGRRSKAIAAANAMPDY